MIKTAVAVEPSLNLPTYERLQQALHLGLRRQVFFVVCDNLSLRNRLAEQLETELLDPDALYPSLVTLELNLEQPHFLLQIAHWLKQHTVKINPQKPLCFQIVGIERLTRQPAPVQRRFLRSLRQIESYLPRLDFNLLLWLPRPWFNNIEQSVPEFWRWRTGVFEFEGEPTPVSTLGLAQPELLPTFLEKSVILPQNLALNYPTTDTQVGEKKANRQPPQADTGFTFQSSDTKTLSDIEEATALIEIAHQYRERIIQGDNSELSLKMALQTYEQSLELLAQNHPSRADILNDMGNLYWMLSRRQSQDLELVLTSLAKAVESYQLALNQINSASARQTYAMIQNNLGAVYSDLARYQDPEENLQLAIRAYEDALQHRSAEDDAHKYASTQNNLGTAYWYLAQQQGSIPYLHAAIQAYQEAVAQYNPEQEPLNWAMLQNNLGTAYWNLSQYEEPEEWLELAISAYENALRYRTPEKAPAACAATQNNLGTAYWHLGLRYTEEVSQWQNYLEKAINAYEIAIALAQKLNQTKPPTIVSFDFLVTLNNLGLVHYQLGTESKFNLETHQQLKHLESALQAHILTLKTEIPESEAYQTTFNYLVRTVRACYHQDGITGQNLALSQIPGNLLSQVLASL